MRHLVGRLQGKVSVVTGSGAGMGRAIALRFAAEGSAVVATDVDAVAAERVAAQIVDAGGEAIAVGMDVSSPESVAAAAEVILGRFDRLDVIVNNAGIFDFFSTLHNTSPAQWNRILGVNLTGPFLVTQALLPRVISSGGGSVVNISSVAGLVGSGGGAAYTASKHGLIGLTKQLTVAYGKDGVRFNVICPGSVDTDLTKDLFHGEGSEAVVAQASAVPAGRYAQPEEVANLALFLASDEASFVYGGVYTVDGGMTTP